MAETGAGYRARLAAGSGDLARVQALRVERFRGGAASDADGHDAAAEHLMVEGPDGRLLACWRATTYADGRAIGASYTARFYDLARLARYPRPMLEIGRFCAAAGPPDPAALRLAWAALRRLAAARAASFLFGCTSFQGVEASAHGAAFGLLAARHRPPRRWAPRVKAPAVVRFPRRAVPDVAAGLRQIPPLLRSYLAMGGWVSDHAVIDRDLGTMHVFTGLEADSVPACRLRALEAAPGGVIEIPA
jgi:putative hemolysin